MRRGVLCRGTCGGDRGGCHGHVRVWAAVHVAVTARRRSAWGGGYGGGGVLCGHTCHGQREGSGLGWLGWLCRLGTLPQ